MGALTRGALVEYNKGLLGPIPNLVVFQFNPENISRTWNIPSDDSNTPEKNGQEEPHQTSGPPGESFTITAHFNAEEKLGAGGPGAVIPKLSGIAPQLAALEKMVYPPGGFTSVIEKAVVDVAEKVLNAISNNNQSQSVPRDTLPSILFIWGPTRVLPVKIQSMSITEEKYDSLLTPLQAKVDLTLSILSFPANADKLSEDPIGTGALKYSQTIKDAQAALNLASNAEIATEIIPF